MGNLYSPTADEVYDALVALEAATEHDGGRKFLTRAPDTGRVEMEVAVRAGLKYVNKTYGRTSPIAAGAIRRKLEELKAEGRILEVANRGGYAVSPKAKCWSTPEHEKLRVAEEQRRADEAADEKTRGIALKERLRAAGFTVQPGYGIQMGLEDFERLADMAGI